MSAARDDAVAKNITINGLVILTDMSLSWNSEHTNPPGGLANYYGDNVIGGPGAFDFGFRSKKLPPTKGFPSPRLSPASTRMATT